jgi:hypothetical protein
MTTAIVDKNAPGELRQAAVDLENGYNRPLKVTN